MTLEERIFRCWNRGSSISETIQTILRNSGERLTFEQVRLAFVELSYRFTATSGTTL